MSYQLIVQQQAEANFIRANRELIEAQQSTISRLRRELSEAKSMLRELQGTQEPRPLVREVSAKRSLSRELQAEQEPDMMKMLSHIDMVESEEPVEFKLREGIDMRHNPVTPNQPTLKKKVRLSPEIAPTQPDTPLKVTKRTAAMSTGGRPKRITAKEVRAMTNKK